MAGIKRKIIFLGKWFFISIFGVVATTATLFYFDYKFHPPKIRQTVCKPQVLEYSIGDIDSRFNLTTDEILVALKNGEGVWESLLGYEVLRYNPESDFKINFVFDERQEYTNQRKEYELGTQKL